ncbi:MAG TPA: non-ribosomal peptide synthetase [Gemmatimonadota bacterium]|nr:non-ribosomal peptide synthetase [Gemmatimonadota bacterium]
MSRSPHPLTAAALETSIGRRFDAVAQACGDRIAIRTPREEISYHDLAKWSDRLAGRVYEQLSKAGGSPGAAVATLLPQGIEAIAAQLGIVKAGGCHVPLNPSHAAASLREVVEHSGSRLLISSRPFSHAATAAAVIGCEVLEIESTRSGGPGRTRLPEVGPDSPATLYYTSGSTGRPKGVLDTHRNVLHNVLRYTVTLNLGPSDRMTLLQSPAFSGSVSSIYGALLNGAMLCPFALDEDAPDLLADWLVESGVTVYHSVPAVFRTLVAGRREYPRMRVVRLEGDRALACDAELFKSSFRRTCVLVNGLGTTETGLARQFFLTHETEVGGAILPVGFPVPDVAALVVDDGGAPLEVGRIGEIVVRSRYLSPGYWRDPARTADRFSTAPDGSGERSYRTGDLGRMRDDGCMEYVGRRDSVIKIHGRSVDSGELERTLLSIPGVADAVVVPREAPSGELDLVAVAVASEPTTAADVRAALRARLPDSPLPTAIVFGNSLPLTPVGKIDRRAVGQMAVGMEEVVEGPPAGDASGSALERQIAGIWADVLGRSHVSMELPFLDQGGDSLHALQILLRIREDLGIEVTPAEFFALPTVSSQALHIEPRLVDGRAFL